MQLCNAMGFHIRLLKFFLLTISGTGSVCFKPEFRNPMPVMIITIPKPIAGMAIKAKKISKFNCLCVEPKLSIILNRYV